MVHVSAIEEALDDKHLPQIEAAFVRLVQWSGQGSVEGAEDASDLGQLLDRVTAALEADRTPMPDDVVQSIAARCGRDDWPQGDRSFAAGARAVAAHHVQWRALFAGGFGQEDARANPFLTT